MSLRLWLLATVLGALGGFSVGQLIEKKQQDYLTKDQITEEAVGNETIPQ